jgi:glutamine amidotransferase
VSPLNVTIFDYGAGNLHSLSKALATPGVVVRTEADPVSAIETDMLVLPGVGAFGHATRCLAPARDLMRRTILDGLPTLGICLGMQLLFETSDEGPGLGLAIFPGRVRRLRARRVPHMGWNGGVYFAHSYVCEPEDASIVSARTDHEGDTFASAIRRDRIVGVQFHPEKSGASGVSFLRAFVDEVRAARRPYLEARYSAGTGALK